MNNEGILSVLKIQNANPKFATHKPNLAPRNPNRAPIESILSTNFELSAWSYSLARIVRYRDSQPLSSIQHPASSIQHRVSSIEHQASSIQHQVSSIQLVFRLIVSNQNFPGFDTVGRTDDALLFHDFNDAGGPVIADAQVPLNHGN